MRRTGNAARPLDWLFRDNAVAFYAKWILPTKLSRQEFLWEVLAAAGITQGTIDEMLKHV
jgi:hypothetical protein